MITYNKLNTYSLWIIVLYPFFSYITLRFFNIDADSFSGLLFFILSIINLFRNNVRFTSILLYSFLLFFYFFFNDILFNKIGDSIIKYLYQNHYLRFCFAIFVIDNTDLSTRFIRRSCFVLFYTLIFGVIVSYIQEKFDPIFFTRFEVSNSLTLDDSWKKVVEYRRHLSVFGYCRGDAVSRNLPMILSLLIAVYTSEYKKISVLFLGSIIAIFSRWRIAMLQYILVCYSYISIKEKLLLRRLLLAFFVALIIVSSIYVLTIFGININEMLFERVSEEDYNTRFLAFDLFYKYFPLNPWFGTGGEKSVSLIKDIDGETYGIHVGYLSLFYYWGVVGGLVFLSYCFFLMKKLFKQAQKSKFYGSFYGLLSLLMINLTDFEFTFYYMGVLLCFIFSRYFYQKQLNEINE